jgi:hypothetical protein
VKTLHLFLGLTLLMSCAGNKVPDQNIISETTTEGAQTTSESLANEDTVADTWGQFIEAPPEVFFAADLSDDVRNGLTDTLLVATAEWGNYGPLEYWVLGTDLKAAQDLTELFCERRLQLGQWVKSDCLSHHTATNSKHNFESYRERGADAIANERASGSMGWNGNRDWGIHFYTSSYPLGFDKRFGSSPGGEQKTIFHEYFHAVQQAHIQTRDHGERRRLMEPTWFTEGGAEYMAQTTTRKLWASGKLTIIDNSGLSSLEQSFENKMKNGKNTIEINCPGVKLGDITNGNDCSQAAYDLGCWAIAYLLNKEGQTALLETFYPSLNELGWEGAFQTTFGMPSEDFYAEFDAFLEKPLADQLAILPKYD